MYMLNHQQEGIVGWVVYNMPLSTAPLTTLNPTLADFGARKFCQFTCQMFMVSSAQVSSTISGLDFITGFLDTAIFFLLGCQTCWQSDLNWWLTDHSTSHHLLVCLLHHFRTGHLNIGKQSWLKCEHIITLLHSTYWQSDLKWQFPNHSTSQHLSVCWNIACGDSSFRKFVRLLTVSSGPVSSWEKAWLGIKYFSSF